ncbi:hypothetical protein F0562_023784 [Nyssa sinensis]|uniref:Uncharacterized protein n=1 Tax=Nyssa sinensis TaxID=561372 RepID=A0A5J5BLN0_9ASTE|nr:hypothetical protein F0562_023784 [Nyssa sinensis]
MIAPMSSFSKSASSSSDEDVELRRGPWTFEEDSLLIRYIACHGEGRWNLLAKRSGLRRTGKSCRLRWLNYLKPDVKRGNLTPQEQLLILDLHSKWGNRWSKIAQHLPGRTDNEIKNYWRTRVQKQARHLKIDTNSTAFQEVIRCFWMPRLIQKIQGSSPSSAISSQTSNTQPFIHIANEHSLLSGQVPAQGPFNMTESLDSLEYQAKNSSSEHCTSPSISSPESMNISQIPQISEYPTGPFHAMANTDHYNTYLKNCYNVDNIGYDTEPFSLTSVSAPGDFGNPFSESCNWIDHNDLADSLWNMDELWQFRQPQERGT